MKNATVPNLRPEGLSPDVYVHPMALVDEPSIGDRTRVWAFAHVMGGAKVGPDCNICEQVFIESGASVGRAVTIKNGVSIWDKVTLEDEVFVGPGVIFTNDMLPRAFLKKGKDAWVPTTVRRRSTLGAGAIILCGNDIGEYALVSAGAVVTAPVPRRALVRGNPARIVAYVCDCLETKIPRNHFEAGRGQVCAKCGVDPTKG